MLRLLDSDFIVKYLGCIEEDDKLNVLLEYVEGGSLHDMLKKFGVFPESLVKLFTYQVFLLILNFILNIILLN